MGNTIGNTATSATISLQQTREIILVDLDAYEVQVWTKDIAGLENVPLVVVNCWDTILAVNYPAKSFGIVHKVDKLFVAKQKCPELYVFKVPNRWDKPDQRTARLSSYKIYDSIKEYFKNCGCDQVKIDYSSKDEFFIDITELVSRQIATGQELQYGDFHHKTILENQKTIHETELESFIREHNEKPLDSCTGEKRLLLAAAIAGKLLQVIKSDTGFQASAGVGINKLQAKLACGHNKPNAVTAFMDPSMDYVSKNIKIKDINGLGGMKGKKIMETFAGAENDEPTMSMYQLRSIPQDLLIREFDEKFAKQVENWALGIDSSPVVNKSTKDSMIIGRKIFTSKRLRTEDDLKEIIHNFCEELIERLEEEKSRNFRRPKIIKIVLTRPTVEGEIRLIDSGSFSCPDLPTVGNIFEKAMEVLQKNWAEKGQPPLQEITKVQMVAEKFVLIDESAMA